MMDGSPGKGREPLPGKGRGLLLREISVVGYMELPHAQD
jgi:hypothetical protein